MIGANDEKVMKACMDVFEVTSSLECRSFIGVLLDGLLDLKCVGLEMAGVYLGCDSDPLSIPDYLDIEGFDMSFEYVDRYVVCSMVEGAKFIKEWCDANVLVEKERVSNSCDKLVRLYGGMTVLVKNETPKDCLLGVFLCSGFGVNGCIGDLLESLLSFKGVSVGMSGVYLGCDEDPENVPAYLSGKGVEMSFGYMGEYVVCSMSVGAFYIRDWCEKNVRSESVGSERVAIMAACNRLVKLYEDFDDAKHGF